MRTAGSSLLPPGGGEEDPAEPAEGLLQRRRPSSQRFVLSGRTSLPVKHSGLAGGALASHITTPTPTPTPRSGPGRKDHRPRVPRSSFLISTALRPQGKGVLTCLMGMARPLPMLSTLQSAVFFSLSKSAPFRDCKRKEEVC